MAKVGEMASSIMLKNPDSLIMAGDSQQMFPVGGARQMSDNGTIGNLGHSAARLGMLVSRFALLSLIPAALFRCGIFLDWLAFGGVGCAYILCASRLLPFGRGLVFVLSLFLILFLGLLFCFGIVLHRFSNLLDIRVLPC